MASLVEELINVLEQENEIYIRLSEYAEQKRQILIDADIEALEKLTVLEQDASDELLSRSNKQVSILKDIANVLGKDSSDITVTKLIGYLETQPEYQKKLIVARDNLLKIATELKQKNNLNEILLNQAMEMTEFDITLFKSMRQAPETANYDRNAYNTGSLLGGSGFDAKQ
ncbi:MAG: flagellar protein FlgN [Agathobacter sp.]|nr:flagellar protein FlgN [Agathobacter sp.]